MNRNYLNMGRMSLILFALVLLAGVVYFMQPDRRTAGERLGDAVGALPHGVDKAGEQLRDRNPAERAGDAVDKAADDVSSAAK